MPRHMYFHREIDQLKKKVLQLGGLVEDRVRRACTLLESRDEAEITSIMTSDWEVDDMEINVEEECLKILALHQPVARDLRLIVAIIKINGELERIADIAVNIAKRVQTIIRFEGAILEFDYQPMAAKVLDMLKISLDALVTEDADLARRLFIEDDDVDSHRNQAYKTVIRKLDDADNGNNAASLLNLYLIARHLERIGDRTTNIAEEIIYLVEGEIVRGGGELDG